LSYQQIKVSNRLLYFYGKDLRTLRSKVRYIDEDITNFRISKLSRREMVKMLVEHELSKEDVQKYISQCHEWDQMKAFVEYGVLPDHSAK